MITRTWKRIVAMMLACVMMYSMIPVGVLAEDTVVTDEQEIVTTLDSEQPAEGSVEEPVATLDEEPVVTPAEEPVVAPAEEPVETPAEEPVVTPAEEPVVAPAEEVVEEPVAEPSEAEKLMAKIDNMLLRYLGDQFRDGERTNEEIVAEVNKLSKSEIVEIVNGLADNRFERLVAEVQNMKDAIDELLADDRAACKNRGVFAALCDATAARKNSTESAALIEARETIISVNAYCGNADLSNMGPEELQSIISAVNTMIMRIEYLDAVDRPAIEEQYGAVIDALSDVKYAAEARLTEINALMAFYAEVELFGMKYNVMADPEILAEGMKYWELLDCKAEIKAIENTINALPPEDTAQFGHLITFIADLKAAVQVRIDELAPKLHSDSLRRDLLPLLEEAREAYCLPYTEEDMWIKLETKVVLIAHGEDPAGDFAKIEKILDIYGQLLDNHKAQIDEEFGAEIVFLTELYADLAELAGSPLDMATRAASKFDTSVTNDYYIVLSEKDYNIISGVTETEIVMNNSDASRRQLFRLFSINPQSSAIELVPGYYQIDKYASDPTNSAYQAAAKVTDMAAYYESNLGYDIVGGMNTALAYDSNAPYSFLMWEGKVLQDKNDSFGLGYEWLNQHTGSCATYLAIKKDGSVELRNGSDPFEEDDWNCVGANFGWLVKDGKLVTTSATRAGDTASRSMIGIKADGTLILCQTDGRGANNSVGQNSYEMGEMMLALGCQWAFNCDGGGSSTFISQRAGEAGLTMRSTPSDGSERPTIHAIFIAKSKGMTPGIFDFAQIHSEYDYFAPNTTYTFTAEAIDTTGAAMAMPEGGVWSLSDDTFGTITDGTFVSNGTLGNVVVMYTVGGKTVEYPIAVVHPESFSFGADGTVIPYGKSVVLAPTVLYGDDDWNVYYQADTFDWAFSDDAVGTWDPATLTYTATTDESKKGPTLTVTYKYSDTLAAVTYKLEFGKGSEIVAGWDFEDGDVSDWMGFSAAKAWSIANGVNNTLVGSDPLAGQFSPENDAHTFLATASNGQVKNGNYALGITFDNTNSAFANWTYNVLFNVGETRVFRDVANGLNATTLGFWLYIPEGGTGLAFQSQFNASPDHSAPSCKQAHFTFVTVNGTRKNLNSCVEADIPANRWVYASIDLTAYDYLSTMPATDETNSRSPSFLRTYIKPGTPAELTFYIDDITLDYSSAVEDRDAPIISAAKYVTADEGVALTDGAQIAGNNVGFTATVADFVAGNASGLNHASAKIYIDGVEVETEATKNAISTKVNVDLENGQHRVTFEIEDNWYNRTQLSYMVNIIGTEDALVVLGGHNDSNTAPETDSVYYVDITTPAAENVAKIEAIIQLNTANTWELDHMIVASGYSVEYNMLDANRTLTATARGNTDIHSVENAVKLTLTRGDNCTLTGEQTLLSIPVRVWSWDGFNNVTEQPEPVPGNIPTVTVDYSILSGSVENAAGETSSFGGSKSVATVMVGQMAADGYKYHVHTVVAMADKPATCTEDGYTGRTYCEGCASVIEWGTTINGGHVYAIEEGKVICTACQEDQKVTGLVEVDGNTYYAIVGNLISGWQIVEDAHYYFDDDTYAGLDGDYPLSDFGLQVGGTYTFENGKLTKGAWVNLPNGIRYYIGNGYMKGWNSIEGDEYYFDRDGYRVSGYTIVVPNPNYPHKRELYHFADDGRLIERVNVTGVYAYDDMIVYLENGWLTQAGLYRENETTVYYFTMDGEAVKNITRYIAAHLIHETAASDGYAADTYTFGADGKMVMKQGFVDNCYYINNKIQKTGLTVIDGDVYYLSTTNGVMNASKTRYVAADCIHESAAAIGLKEGTYTFGADGKAVFETATPTPTPTATPTPTPGSVATPTPTATASPTPEEVKNGIIGDYYYINNEMQKTGLTVVDGSVYYFSTTNGAMNRDKTRYVAADCIHESAAALGLKDGYYTFGPDGKMPVEESKEGIVDGYYYINGILQKPGLIVIDGDVYYFSTTNGAMNVNKTRYVAADCIHESATSIGLKAGNYTFGADGKAVLGSATPTPPPSVTPTPGGGETTEPPATPTPTPEEVKNGIVGDYYYIDNVIQKTGLTVVDGGVYYFSTTNGVMNRNKTRTVAADCIHESAAELGLRAGSYTFGEDGRMPVDESKNGIVDGYYYIHGILQKPGLIVIDGEIYYFSTTNGAMNVNKTRYVAADCLHKSAIDIGLKEGNYTFDQEGKAVK